MKNGKYMKKRALNVKALALVLTLSLLVCGAIGGTIAWLADDTDPVVNTFTGSDVDIELTESDNLDLKMVPGKPITKDPKVTVLADSEACYVFVEVVESDNFDTFMTYEMAAGWIPVVDENEDGIADDGVYYRTVATSATAQDFPVLKDNKVTVSPDVDRDDMETLTENSKPTLTFTAYAIQSEYLTDQDSDNDVDAADAWELVKP